MRKLLTRALDRVTLRIASSFRADGAADQTQLIEAEKWLRDGSFFFDFDEVTPELRFDGGGEEFEFTSPVSTRWPENNRVFGRLFRAGPHWQSRPSVILLHGWSAELQYRWQFRFLGKKLARSGVNAAMFELPYHGRRTPRAPGAIQNFISHDLLHMLEAARQSLADARALLSWLAAQGSPNVGVWGVSLGAWLAGLLICGKRPVNSGGKARAGFAVLLTPIANMAQAIEELPFCESIRCRVQGTSLPLDRLNLAAYSPVLPPENILIIEGEHDLFAPACTVEQLWRAWGQPQIWRLPHGHISVLLSPLVSRRVVKWIAQQQRRDTD